MKVPLFSVATIALLALHHFTGNYSSLVIVQSYYFFLACVSLFAAMCVLLIRTTDSVKHKEIIKEIQSKTSICGNVFGLLVNLFVTVYFLLVKDSPLSAIAGFVTCSTSVFIINELYNNGRN